MIQKPIRDFNDQTFLPEEAAEWLKELNDRTKSDQEGYNSIDEVASLIKLLENAVQALQNGAAGEVFLNRAAATDAWGNRTADTTQPEDGLTIYLITEKEFHTWDSTDTVNRTKFVRSYITVAEASDPLQGGTGVETGGQIYNKVKAELIPDLSAEEVYTESGIIISGAIAKTSGYTDENGDLVTGGSLNCATPIAIPNGVTKIIFLSTDISETINYVNCYSGDDFTGYLGTSDNKTWGSLAIGEQFIGVEMELQTGTNFISFITKGTGFEIQTAIISDKNSNEIPQLKKTVLKYGSKDLEIPYPDLSSEEVYTEINPIISGAIAKTSGYTDENGDLVTGGSLNCATPIAIPNGVTKIIFLSTDISETINYVNCYSGDDFTGYLGTSDNKTWGSLAIGEQFIGVEMELQTGTNFISFITKGTGFEIQTAIISDKNSVLEKTILNYKGKKIEIPYPKYSASSGKLPYQSANIRFQIPVNCNVADNLSNTTSLQDSELIYNDWGVLMLPENYDPNGNPTRLVIGCHGAGGTVSSSQSQTEGRTEYQYLVANGYAVMDMNGLPEDYATLIGIDIRNNIGSPIAVQSYVKGVEWVLEKYNIASNGVFIFGGSMGGISSSNLVMSNSLKIIAHGINCPVLDTYNNIWLNAWSSGLPKVALEKMYGLEETSVGSGVYVYDEDKLRGYNPMLNSMVSYDSTTKLFADNKEVATASALSNFDEIKNYPCPLKIWHSVDDPTVSFETSVRHVKAIRKGGQIAYLRSIPTGGHAPLDVGTALSSPSGSINYKGTTLSIKPIVEEMYLWFKRFSK